MLTVNIVINIDLGYFNVFFFNKYNEPDSSFSG